MPVVKNRWGNYVKMRGQGMGGNNCRSNTVTCAIAGERGTEWDEGPTWGEGLPPPMTLPFLWWQSRGRDQLSPTQLSASLGRQNKCFVQVPWRFDCLAIGHSLICLVYYFCGLFVECKCSDGVIQILSNYSIQTTPNPQRISPIDWVSDVFSYTLSII